MKDCFRMLPHDDVFNDFFNKNNGVAGVCKYILNDKLEENNVLQNVREKSNNSGVKCVYNSSNFDFYYETYYIKDNSPYAIKINSYFSSGSFLLEVRLDDKNALQVRCKYHIYDKENKIIKCENFEEIHFNKDFIMLDHYKLFQHYKNNPLDKYNDIITKVLLTCDFNIIDKNIKYTKIIKATKPLLNKSFPDDFYNTRQRNLMAKNLIEEVGKKELIIFNNVETKDDEIREYIEKQEEIFNNYERDFRVLEDVVKTPEIITFSGMMMF